MHDELKKVITKLKEDAVIATIPTNLSFESGVACEWCNRVCDVCDDDLARAAGWSEGWDGWACPGCLKK